MEMKNPWNMFGKIAISLGGVFLAMSIIVFISNSYQLSELTNAFGINGIGWTILGIISLLYSGWISIKLRRLEREGFMYDAEIVQLRISPFIRIGGYITVFAECTYQNQENKVCLIKSKLFLQNCQKDELKAKVYVNRNNPRDYAVKIFTEVKETAYDYDYR